MKSRVVIAALATAIVATTGAADAAAGNWKTVARHHGTERTQATADIMHPHGIRVRVTAHKSPVLTYWSEICSHKAGSKTKTGKFTTHPSKTKSVPLPAIFSDDVECIINTQSTEKGEAKIVLAIQKRV